MELHENEENVEKHDKKINNNNNDNTSIFMDFLNWRPDFKKSNLIFEKKLTIRDRIEELTKKEESLIKDSEITTIEYEDLVIKINEMIEKNNKELNKKLLPLYNLRSSNLKQKITKIENNLLQLRNKKQTFEMFENAGIVDLNDQDLDLMD
jgi:predicted nuclease with TOPRIM domain